VTATLKNDLELERMADLAVGAARRATAIASATPAVPMPEGMEAMAVLAAEMVRGSLDALADGDADRARAVIAGDDEVDRHCREVIDELRQMMRSGEAGIDPGLALLSDAANLEWIADHATNIAEEVVHLEEGLIIRHAYSAPGSPTGGGQAPCRGAAETRCSAA
jgi:phosphate transport system protein